MGRLSRVEDRRLSARPRASLPRLGAVATVSAGASGISAVELPRLRGPPAERPQTPGEGRTRGLLGLLGPSARAHRGAGTGAGTKAFAAPPTPARSGHVPGDASQPTGPAASDFTSAPIQDAGATIARGRRAKVRVEQRQDDRRPGAEIMKMLGRRRPGGERRTAARPTGTSAAGRGEAQAMSEARSKRRRSERRQRAGAPSGARAVRARPGRAAGAGRGGGGARAPPPAARGRGGAHGGAARGGRVVRRAQRGGRRRRRSAGAHARSVPVHRCDLTSVDRSSVRRCAAPVLAASRHGVDPRPSPAAQQR